MLYTARGAVGDTVTARPRLPAQSTSVERPGAQPPRGGSYSHSTKGVSSSATRGRARGPPCVRPLSVCRRVRPID
eukprot:2217947-Pleurochrysis_carterae.AAC.9